MRTITPSFAGSTHQLRTARPAVIYYKQLVKACRSGPRDCQVVCIDYAAPGHAKDGHPECPARLDAITGALRALTASQRPELDPLAAALHWRRGSGRLATDEELRLVHPQAYLDAIRAACGKLTGPKLVDDSTYLAPGSFEECARSTGAVLDLLDQLLLPPPPPSSRSGSSSSCSNSSGGTAAGGFALVRPPGHHVLPTRPMGFGVLNTAAVAVRYARQRHGVQRVLIVDFDVHHGNGTQEVFYTDPDTLYISTHQAGLWPYTGKVKEVGAGAGRGANINIPLPGGSGDQAMAQAWSRVVLPAAERFRPQLVLVSAGFDAHWRDPLASMQLTAATYHWMCAELAELAQRWCPGRLALVLEGGYHTPSLAESVAASLCGLLLLPPPRSTLLLSPAVQQQAPREHPHRRTITTAAAAAAAAAAAVAAGGGDGDRDDQPPRGGLGQGQGQQLQPPSPPPSRAAADWRGSISGGSGGGGGDGAIGCAGGVMLPSPGPRELYEEPLARVDAVLQEVCSLHGL
ncbi:hypothetical protein HYH02_009572 [Chlamydomonas schloesseri]|uniref:Histone deacetylase domain-containing protein n=1 Tax=Chlamydomonas schloesseri TaxID=2026947 RepID=A0A835TG70_9CHLO|nr:hypothetical protein HYH02_009572 [Chlamydomonas schloesseri]|eukprot:KAG2443162.1 hypothetical protein HYH02_009572 [Chlamydomonas schloesseri]